MKKEKKNIYYWSTVALLILGLVWIFFAQYGRITLEEHATFVEIRGHRLTVEVVSDETMRSKGLGGHAPLSDDEGMLFVFPTSEIRTFWMKGMTFPIDIVWLAGSDPRSLRIVGYEENVDPQMGAQDYELKFYTSSEPVSYVLEVRGGLMRKFGVLSGDIVAVSFLLK